MSDEVTHQGEPLFPPRGEGMPGSSPPSALDTLRLSNFLGTSILELKENHGVVG